MKATKHRYYETLDRQSTAERVLERHLAAGGERMNHERSGPSDLRADFHSTDVLYQELGIKTFSAVSNFLEWIGHLGAAGHGGRGQSSDAVKQAVTESNREMASQLESKLAALQERLERWEARLGAIEAGMKRIDRFTLEAIRDLEEMKREGYAMAPVHTSGPGEPAAVDRGRLAKEDAAQLALDAGRRMREQGKRLTLASVAREAGLKYGQIVYAFGNKDAFFRQLEEDFAAEKETDEAAV